MPNQVHQLPTFKPAAHAGSLRVDQQHRAVVNLRGDARDPAFVSSVRQALGLSLPAQACTSASNVRLRMVWVGPDDWFVIGPAGEQNDIAAALRQALAGQHAAVTDVSSGYFLVNLSGPSARVLLSHGCPMDFHPTVFRVDQVASTHFFKVGITIWQTGPAPDFGLLVRRSFIDHFWQLAQACSREFGLVAGRADPVSQGA